MQALDTCGSIMNSTMLEKMHLFVKDVVSIRLKINRTFVLVECSPQFVVSSVYSGGMQNIILHDFKVTQHGVSILYTTGDFGGEVFLCTLCHLGRYFKASISTKCFNVLAETLKSQHFIKAVTKAYST